jgi:hypothetical protein
VTIEYKLTAEHPEERYQIWIYSSLDNFKKPLSNVEGDVGLNITPGQKTIIWDYSKSIYGYNVGVQFELAYELMFDPLRFEMMNYKAVKRGGTQEIRWSGSEIKDELTLQLLRHGVVAKEYTDLPNSGYFNMSVGKRKGKGYQLALISEKDPLNRTLSEKFRIKSKVAFIWKALPFILGGIYGAYAYLTYVPPLPGPPNPD